MGSFSENGAGYRVQSASTKNVGVDRFLWKRKHFKKNLKEKF